MPPDEPKLSGRARSIANLIPFKKGEKGRPGATRNRLQGDFLRRLADDFERFGIYAIARVRRDDPAAYVRAIASLMPKEVTVTTDAIDELSDDQLDAAIAAVRAVLAAQGDGKPAGEAAVAEPASALSAVPEAS